MTTILEGLTHEELYSKYRAQTENDPLKLEWRRSRSREWHSYWKIFEIKGTDLIYLSDGFCAGFNTLAGLSDILKKELPTKLVRLVRPYPKWFHKFLEEY